ncbi:MAG: hypothetical protein P8X82_16770 [Gemmatimonadales bacterium]
MSWQALGAIGELVGAFAVIAARGAAIASYAAEKRPATAGRLSRR